MLILITRTGVGTGIGMGMGSVAKGYYSLGGRRDRAKR